MLGTVRISQDQFKKLNMKKAYYAHINEKDIFIVFRNKVQGAEVEYSFEVERQGLISVPKMDNISSFYVSESLVKYLKEITHISHYPNNESTAGKEEGIKSNTVIAHTNRGSFSQSIYSVNGRKINTADIEAIYK